MTVMESRNYQILNTIATGGTAVLYKAIQTSLDREVVIKKLHSHLISDKNFTGRFELEAKAAASLDHENIVRIIDSGTERDNYFIVMEYIDGVTLKDILEKHGPLSDEITMLLAREICMGLDHAHQRGIIHRDIKPANIMITFEGQVKITDFGLAKLCQSHLQQTMADTLLGTPLYMSPEQAFGEGIDGRSDLFSLGTVCYELMTGAQPFLGANYAVVIQNIIKCAAPPPSRIRKNIDPQAESIVMKALSREPGKRYRTALEMARTIESALGQDKIAGARERFRRLVAGDDGAERRIAPKFSKRRSRRRLVPLSIAAAIISLTAVYLYMNPGRFDLVKSRIRALQTTRPLSPEDNPVLTAQGITGNVPLPVMENGTPPSAATGLTPDTAAGGTPGATPGGTPAATPAATRYDDYVQASAADTSAAGVSAPGIALPSPAAENAAAEPVPDPAAARADTIVSAGPAGSPRSLVPDVSAGEEAPKTGNPGKTPDVAGSDAEPRKAVPVQAARTGFMDIQVEPEADIIVDGELMTSGTRYGPVEIEPGAHRITCRRKDFREYSETIRVTPGELSRRRIFLEMTTGQLGLMIEPGIRVFVDGKFVGMTPLSSTVKLAAGKHLVDLKKTGFQDWSNEVYIPPDDTVSLRIVLSPL